MAGEACSFSAAIFPAMAVDLKTVVEICSCAASS